MTTDKDALAEALKRKLYDELGREMPKPVEYWRNCLDAEIMDVLRLGSTKGLRGSLELTDLARERLYELMACGHSGLAHMIDRKNEKGVKL